jgi:hypothetical protein
MLDREILEGKGFAPTVTGDADGTVFRQDPSGGESRYPGASVRVWLQPPNPASTAGASTPSETSTPATGEANLQLVDNSLDWRGIGLTAFVVVVAAAGAVGLGAGALLARRALVRRRFGKRWAKRHLEIHGSADHPTFGLPANESADGGPHSIEVLAGYRESALIIRERSE